MSTQTKPIERIVTVTDMSVKGGALPDGFQVYLNVSFDFTDVTDDELMGYCCEGSSLRVKAQGQLRNWSVAKLTVAGVVSNLKLTADVKEALAQKKAIEFLVETDFEKTDTTGPRNPVKTAESAYKKMDRTQKEEMMKGMGIPSNVILATLAKEFGDAEQQSEEATDTDES